MLWLFIEAVWLILPAYAANGLATLSRLFKKTHPIDREAKLAGRPLLGPTKTWEGLIVGTIIGTTIAGIQMVVLPYLPFDQAPVILTIVPMSPLLGFILGLGAMVGDLAGSFIKRRAGISPGRPAPVLDQIDFLIFSLLFASMLITLKWEWVAMLLIITPVLHYAACIVGYLLKIKREPW